MKFPKPKKKVKKGTLKRKADNLFSKYLRAKIPYCQAEGKTICKCGGPLQLCHIITRGNLRLRYDENNCLVMCAGCHRFFTSRPFEFTEFVLTYYLEKFTYVMNHKEEKVQMKLQDYYYLIAKYETN